MVDYVSGQQICTTCGFDDLPVDESGEVAPKEPNRRSRYLEKRAKKLAEFGIHGSVSQTMLNAFTRQQVEELSKEMGRRGIFRILPGRAHSSPLASVPMPPTRTS